MFATVIPFPHLTFLRRIISQDGLHFAPAFSFAEQTILGDLLEAGSVIAISNAEGQPGYRITAQAIAEIAYLDQFTGYIAPVVIEPVATPAPISEVITEPDTYEAPTEAETEPAAPIVVEAPVIEAEPAPAPEPEAEAPIAEEPTAPEEPAGEEAPKATE
jgi:hypothetical protein